MVTHQAAERYSVTWSLTMLTLAAAAAASHHVGAQLPRAGGVPFGTGQRPRLTLWPFPVPYHHAIFGSRDHALPDATTPERIPSPPHLRRNDGGNRRRIRWSLPDLLSLNPAASP